jgi:hypothetical protein
MVIFVNCSLCLICTPYVSTIRVHLVKIKKATRLPLFAHSRNCYTCNHTFEKEREEQFWWHKGMYFVKHLIYFHKRNDRAGKKQISHFTTLLGNWPLWRSDILGEIFSSSNDSNAAPCSKRPYTFQGPFIQSVIELNAIIFPYIIV